MLPHLTPRRSKCTAFGCAENGALERLPGSLPRPQHGKGHSRSYPERTSPQARQTACPCTFCLCQPVCLDSPAPHKLPPQDPRPVGPQMEGPQSEPAASSQAPGHPAFTAVFSFGARMPSASLVPLASWPCCPSTLRLSRSPQPPSRRTVQAGPRPSSQPPPAVILWARSAARRSPCPQNDRAFTLNNQTMQTNQRPPYPRLLDPTYSLRTNQEGVRDAHLDFLPPCVMLSST